MFSFLKKKVQLKDYLSGFVDIHNHILPGIDDGAGSIEDSISLIRKFSEIGVKEFIATPHIMNDYYPNTPETINTALVDVKKALQNEGLTEIRINAAAEYMIDQSFLELVQNGKLLTLKDNFVLVEMSYFQAPINLNEILFQLQTNKYRPVLAHPERYAFYHSRNLDMYKELKDRGCFFQLNILSLTGHYGKNIQETAFQLLDQQLIDYIGSDTHQMRHLDKLWEYKIEEKRAEQLKPILENTVSTFQPSFS